VRLLLRSTHGLTPTDAGHDFYERAKRSIEDVEEAEAAARGAGDDLVYATGNRTPEVITMSMRSPPLGRRETVPSIDWRSGDIEIKQSRVGRYKRVTFEPSELLRWLGPAASIGDPLPPDEKTVRIEVGGMQLTGLDEIQLALRAGRAMAKGYVLHDDNLLGEARTFPPHIWEFTRARVDKRGNLYAILSDGRRLVHITLVAPDQVDPLGSAAPTDRLDTSEQQQKESPRDASRKKPVAKKRRAMAEKLHAAVEDLIITKRIDPDTPSRDDLQEMIVKACGYTWDPNNIPYGLKDIRTILAVVEQVRAAHKTKPKSK